MKFVAISDTHGKHDQLTLPAGDVLLHAGDISMKGGEAAAITFLNWFAQQDFAYKIFIAGNHDFYFESASNQQIKDLIPDNITYLQDSGTTINNIRIWGSPITPWFFNMAFNRQRGAAIERHWDLIPADTDLLLTHGPLYDVLDQNFEGEHVGCRDLQQRVHAIKPKVHLCGHIHPSYGIGDHGEIKFINASVVNDQYEVVNPPITFDL